MGAVPHDHKQSFAGAGQLAIAAGKAHIEYVDRRTDDFWRVPMACALDHSPEKVRIRRPARSPFRDWRRASMSML